MTTAWREGILIDQSPSSRATVIAMHGFTRSGAHLQRLADSLVAEDLTVLRPTLRSLWWPRSMNRRTVIDELARHVGALLGEESVAVVGHSAGAAAGACLAARLLDNGVKVRGLVFVDGVESPTHHIANAWSSIASSRVRVVAAPPSACNRHGELVRWLTPRMVGDFGVEIAGSGHGDIEGEAHSIYRLACRATGDAHTRARVLDHVVADALRVLDIEPLHDVADFTNAGTDRILTGTAER